MHRPVVFILNKQNYGEELEASPSTDAGMRWTSEIQRILCLFFSFITLFFEIRLGKKGKSRGDFGLVKAVGLGRPPVRPLRSPQ